MDDTFIPFTPPTFIQHINDLCHHPIISPFAYAGFWSVFCILSPLGALFLLISLPFFVIKEVILKVNAIIYDKSNPNHLSQDHAELVVVVTGCDTGFGNDLVLKLLKSPPPPAPVLPAHP